MSRLKYTIRLLSTAEEDLAEIITYIAIDKSAAADVLLDAVERRLLALRDHPFIGRLPDDLTLKKLGYRYLVVENYLLFYTIQEGVVLVHRVVHGRRDYQGLL